MPTIELDDEVYTWLQSQARPFEDTPNSVLRRVAGLATSRQHGRRVSQRTTAKRLMARWKIDAAQGRYHKDGTFFEKLTQFPGVLMDVNGYVRFERASEYLSSKALRIGKKVNVVGGISEIPGYTRFE